MQVGYRGSESFIGTDPGRHCASTPATQDEPAPDLWPLDFDDNQTADLGDVLKYNLPFGAVDPDPLYSKRLDLNADGSINLGDLLQYNFVFGESCTK